MKDSFSMPSMPPPSDCSRDPAERWTGPLFIVGMPRSGTKLLRGLLGQHPRIRIPSTETDFFPFLVRWVREHGLPEQPDAFATLFEELRHGPYFTLRPGAAEFDWREWREHCAGRYDAAGLFEGFVRYETGSGAQTSCIWGDKSPAYTRHVGALLEHFPHARVVHIVRDVRDYCLSIRKAWNKDIRRAAYQWGCDVGYAHRICRGHPRCIELRYEELVQAPQEQMRRLSEFLQIEFSDAMTRLERPVEKSGAAEVLKGNSQKFATGLKPREIRAVESLAWDTMQALGYRPRYATRQRRLGAIERHVLRIKDATRLVMRAARHRGLAAALRFHWSHARLAN